MNEGALTLTTDKTILYANQCFARMVKCPLEQVIGNSFRRFLSVKDRALLRPLLKRPVNSGSKIQVLLNAADGSQIPALISIRPIARDGLKKTIVGMIVTDMTEPRRTEEQLRALTHRLIEAQETERGGVALKLHNHITQVLCAVLVRSQTLADRLSIRDGPSKREAIRLRDLLGQAASEVELISHKLRPSVLDELGLVAIVRDTGAEFADRTGLSVNLVGVHLTARLPADAELTLYRILQEALKNVEKHACAHHVTLQLAQRGAFVQLDIHDDGVGFDTDRRPAGRKGRGNLGLLNMRERATHIGGTLKVKSGRGAGTEIKVRIPLSVCVARAKMN
jgi:PAS domain S-box-containing protein